MLKRIWLAIIALAAIPVAYSVPLETVATFNAAHPNEARVAPTAKFVARGSGTNDFYYMEVDPTTGRFPVDAQFTFDTLLQEDHNYGAVGDDTLRTAAQLGNATGAADYNYGAVGAQTLRSACMIGLGSAVVSDANPVPISDAGGAVTVDGTVAATQSGNWSTRMQDGSGNALSSTGGALHVSDGGGTVTVDGSVSVSSTPSPTGRAYADSVRLVYSSTNVTTGAWVELIASTAATINHLVIDDTCGEVLELGTGAAAAESRKLLIPRGGHSQGVALAIASGTRVAIKAVSGNCTAGDIVITGLN